MNSYSDPLIPIEEPACPSCKQRIRSLIARGKQHIDVLLERMVTPFRLDRDMGSSALVNCTMSADLSHIVTTYEDFSMRVWSKSDDYWECEQKWQAHDDEIQSIHMADDASLIVSAGCDDATRIWSKQANQWVEQQTIWAREEIWTCFFQDSVLIQAGMETVIRLYEQQQDGNWAQFQFLKGHGECIADCAFSEDMKTAVSAGYTLCLWQKDNSNWRILDRVSLMKRGAEWHFELGYLNFLAMARDASVIVVTYREPKCFCSIVVIKESQLHRTQQIRIGNSIRNNVTMALSESGSFMLLPQAKGYGVTMWLQEGEVYKEHQVLHGHTDRVSCIFASENDDSSRMISTASNDKTFMIWRYDSSIPESHAYKAVHIRDATDYEMFKPMMLITLTLLQKVAMAFAKEIPWNQDTVRPVVVPLGMLTMFDFFFSLDIELVFWIKSTASLLAMISFLVTAWYGSPHLAVLLLATFAVVPAVKQVGLILACDSEGHLIAVPTITCFEGLHLCYAVTAVALSVPFLLLLIPFTAAEGDSEVMPPHIWLQPREWAIRKADKATGLDLGLLRASGLGSFVGAYADMFAKLALPLISVFCYGNPMQLVVLSLLSVMPSLISNIAISPKKDRLINAALITTETMVVFAYIAALISVVVNNASLIWPAVVFYVGMVLIVASFLVWVRINIEDRTVKAGTGLDLAYRWFYGKYVPAPMKKLGNEKMDADDDGDSEESDDHEGDDDGDADDLPDSVGKHPKARILEAMTPTKRCLT